ncbi:MAG: hypothetical protein ACFE8M_05085 [Candidatus Hermodarchaeota archaeon]
MQWEKVISHGHREDLYIYKVLTPHNETADDDKKILKNILLVEVGRESSD